VILNKQHYKIVSFFYGFFLFMFSRLRFVLSKSERSLSLVALESARLPILKRGEDQSTACVSCGLCVEFCPTSAIRFVGQLNTSPVSFELNIQRCVECSICIEICPVDALARGAEGTRAMSGDELAWQNL
jgi:formate hydrogenlyase subunit 6/NADH:ubiquinone oxidoreductase subunit I